MAAVYRSLVWDSSNRTALIPRKWLSCNIVTTPSLRSPRAQPGTSKQRPVFSSAPIIGCCQGSGTLLRETHCAMRANKLDPDTWVTSARMRKFDPRNPAFWLWIGAIPTTDKIQGAMPPFLCDITPLPNTMQRCNSPLSFSGFRGRSKCSQAGYRRQWGLEAYGRSLAHLDEMLPDQLDLRSMGRVPVLHGEAVVVVHELLWCC